MSKTNNHLSSPLVQGRKRGQLNYNLLFTRKLSLKMSFRQVLSRNPGFPVKTGIQCLWFLDSRLRRN